MRSFRGFLAALAVVSFAACGERERTEPAPQPDQRVTVEPRPYDEGDQRFLTEYRAILAQAPQVDHAALVNAYGNGTYATQLQYDPLQASYLDVVSDAYGGLRDSERAYLAQHGFVAPERLADATFGSAYLNIYQLDLPVFISTDSILHAMHRTYDAVLKDVEKQDLVTRLGNILQGTHVALGQNPPAGDASNDVVAAHADADLFVAVARSLLAGAAVDPVVPANATRLEQLLPLLAAEQLTTVELFGDKGRVEDFSQLKPRGHYAGDEVLEPYFRAMMWLGRTDMRPIEYDLEGNARFQPRQLAAAAFLTRAVEAGLQQGNWDVFDRTLGVFVGEADSMNVNGMTAFLADAGVTNLEALFDPARANELTDKLYKGGYGKQRINSQFLLTDPWSSEPGKLPLSFTFMGQRFIVDSYVFSNLVYDRLVVGDRKVLRAMPVGFDALAVLGSGTAIEQLGAEIGEYGYAGAVGAMRFLVDGYDDGFWQANMYNGWLTAIRALNAPTTAETFPQAMRTEAWHRKTLNTQAGSWAQLRHDTILYAKQSYTSAAGCEYPTAFVEPRPEFFNAVGRFARLATTALDQLPLDGAAQALQMARATLMNFDETSARLALLAQRELDGIPFEPADADWLRSVIFSEPAGCVESYGGWYARLFYEGPEASVERDHTIADVHTNPNLDGPLAPQRVLHLGTGDVRVMIFTAESCDGLFAYAGPIYNYYEHTEQGLTRLNDQEWTGKLDDTNNRPALPAWARFE